MKHLMRIHRGVRLGGFRLWPSKRRFGGRVYTVAPMSLLVFMQFVDAAARLGAPSVSVLALSPRLYILPLSPFLLTTIPRSCDLERATDLQAAALMEAVMECNDLEYIFERLAENSKPDDEDEEGRSGVKWSLIDAIDFAVEQRPVKDWEGYMRMPAQEFFAIMECVRKKFEARRPPADGEDEDGFKEISPAEMMALAERQESGGANV